MIECEEMSQAAADTVVALRCSLDYPDIETFIVRYGRNLSTRGIFLPSADPPPAGTAVRFELVLADGRSILRGEGVVVGRASLDGNEPERLHGMAVRYSRLDSAGRALVERVTAHKAAHPAGYYEPAPDLVDRTLPGIPADAIPTVPQSGPSGPTRPSITISGRVASLPLASGPEDAELEALRTPPPLLPSLPPRETAQRLEALLARRG